MASNYDYLKQQSFEPPELLSSQPTHQQPPPLQPTRRASQKASALAASPPRPVLPNQSLQPSPQARSSSRTAQALPTSTTQQQEIPQFGPQQQVPSPHAQPQYQLDPQIQYQSEYLAQQGQCPTQYTQAQSQQGPRQQIQPLQHGAQQPQHPHETPTPPSQSQPYTSQQQATTSASTSYATRPSLYLGPYDTREHAFASAQEYAFAQGYCLVNQGSAKSKSTNGKYNPQGDVVRVDLMCDRGGMCNPSGKGLRKRSSNRTNCPCKMKLVYNRTKGSRWYISIRNEEHNHELLVGRMHENATFRRYRRIQAGGSRLETPTERYHRVTKDKTKPQSEPAPPAWHTPIVPEPPADEPGVPPPASTATPTNPVHLAASRGQEKILTILLNKGADINALDSMGQTPLHCAIESGKMETIKLLVERSADVSRKDAKGTSVLAAAVARDLEDAVVLLIENGADPNV